MGYQKFLIDNVTCSRRFHVVFDPDAPAAAKTEVRCAYCDMTIFSAENHPPVKVARQENLVQTAQLSDHLIRKCDFRDVMTEQTVPGKKGKQQPLYHK